MYDQAQFLEMLQNALDQPAEERVAFVQTHSDDPILAEEVLTSLEEMDNFGDFLERPAVIVLTEAGLL